MKFIFVWKKNFGAFNFFKHALIYRILHLSISWVHGPIVQDFIPSSIIKALPFIWHVSKNDFPLKVRGYTSLITNLCGVTAVINWKHNQDVNSFKRYPKLLIYKYLRESRATVFYRKKTTYRVIYLLKKWRKQHQLQNIAFY